MWINIWLAALPLCFLIIPEISMLTSHLERKRGDDVVGSFSAPHVYIRLYILKTYHNVHRMYWEMVSSFSLSFFSLKFSGLKSRSVNKQNKNIELQGKNKMG